MLNKKVLEQKEKIYSYINELWLDPSKIKNEGLLLQAFVHKSFAADFKKILWHNERLEFVW
jgi:dsRNA-specific ribonuclease